MLLARIKKISTAVNHTPQQNDPSCKVKLQPWTREKNSTLKSHKENASTSTVQLDQPLNKRPTLVRGERGLKIAFSPYHNQKGKKIPVKVIKLAIVTEEERKNCINRLERLVLTANNYTGTMLKIERLHLFIYHSHYIDIKSLRR